MTRIQWRPEDEELAEFIVEYLDTFCTWDVLVFLANNPDAVNAAGEIAALVGRPVDDVSVCMNDLAARGLVAVDATPGGAGVLRYRLVDDEARRAVLRRFAAGQEDRMVRMEALRHVMARAQERPGGAPFA